MGLEMSFSRLSLATSGALNPSLAHPVRTQTLGSGRRTPEDDLHVTLTPKGHSLAEEAS